MVEDIRVRCALCAEDAGFTSSSAFEGWVHAYLLEDGELKIPSDEAILAFTSQVPESCYFVDFSIEVVSGTYDGLTTTHTVKQALINSFKARDKALQEYFKEELLDGGKTWLDVIRAKPLY